MAGARKASADIAPRSAEAASVFGESIVLGFAESASRSQKRGSVVGDNFQTREGGPLAATRPILHFLSLPFPRHRGIGSVSLQIQ